MSFVRPKLNIGQYRQEIQSGRRLNKERLDQKEQATYEKMKYLINNTLVENPLALQWKFSCIDLSKRTIATIKTSLINNGFRVEIEGPRTERDGIQSYYKVHNLIVKFNQNQQVDQGNEEKEMGDHPPGGPAFCNNQFVKNAGMKKIIQDLYTAQFQKYMAKAEQLLSSALPGATVSLSLDEDCPVIVRQWLEDSLKELGAKVQYQKKRQEQDGIQSFYTVPAKFLITLN